MLKLLSVFICVVSFCPGLLTQPVANSLIPKVDERMELLSIVYKLAVANDYDVDTLNPVYSKAVYNHFNRYSNHPFIKYIKQIADSLAKDSIDIGNWEIPSIAMHISQPPDFSPLITFHDTAYADGWDDRTLLTEKFIALLKQFYKDTDCSTFFKLQQSYYETVDREVEREIIQVNKKWFENFFTLPATENYYAITSLQNIGVWDYIRVNFSNNRRNTYTVFGCDTFDKNGIPTNFANPQIARKYLHEYIHAFTNQLVDKNIFVLQKPAEIILSNPKVWEHVKGAFYNNWQFILYESLVRACSVKYISGNEGFETTRDKEILMQEKYGFFWMRGLVEKLDDYEKNRSKYKSLEDFMPEIKKYFEKVAEDIKDDKFVFPAE